MAFFKYFMNAKGLVFFGVLFALFYYGWPIIEAVLSVLPVPGVTETIEGVKAMGSGLF